MRQLEGEPVIRLALVLLLSTSAALAAEPAPPLDARALLQQYKCYMCHADDAPKAGPAYSDVAAAYRGNRLAPSSIAAVIRRGQHGSGPWNMPPHPEVSQAEAEAMAQYILSLAP